MKRCGLMLLLLTLSACDRTPPRQATTQASTQPATTQATTAPAPIADYANWLHANDPKIPATQPLATPVTLEEAAAIVTRDPVYLDSTSLLWITRPDAPPAEAVLSQTDDSPRIVRDRVLFVHWSMDDAGTFHPNVITSNEVITSKGRTKLATKRDYDWSRATSWYNRMVVPSNSGIAIITLEPWSENYVNLAQPKPTAPPWVPPQWTLDTQGLLAWIPNSSSSVQRFVEGQWSPLKDWPQHIMHLIPLLDGSVLQIIAHDDGTVAVEHSSLTNAAIDEKHIEDLVGQLSDLDADKRKAAYNELYQTGPAIWPVLERLKENQPPEAQASLAQLLSERENPTLGGFTAVHGKLSVVSRLSDGGCVMYAPDGVTYYEANKNTPSTVAPAWLSVRPGRPISLLFSSFTFDLPPDQAKISARGDEWIVSDPANGPRRFLGNHLAPLLPKSKRKDFLDWLGIDRHSRWIFRATDGRTLILDPTVPDPTPRLPVWPIEIEKGSAGWTPDDWPAIKKGGPWALQKSEWKPLDKNFSPINTLDPKPTTAPSDHLILKDTDGREFFDGTSQFRLRANGKYTAVPLPDAAKGPGPVTLIRAGDNRLFLFNKPGRVIRLREENNQFIIDGTFTTEIPENPTRIWKDPAGRIVIAYGGNKLSILFPDGRIPLELLPIVPALTTNEDR